MKIVHICLACFFPDGYSYQENMLPKFHKELGYDVEVIASLLTFDEYGDFTDYPVASTYVNEHGIKVTRLEYAKPTVIWRKLRKYVGLKHALEIAKPDILFIHGCQFLDVDIIKKFAQKHDVKIYVDNHADFTNSATNWLSKEILHKKIWRYCAHVLEPYTEKFYGVLPVRVDFLEDVYGIPKNKCELLVMGADDQLVANASREEVKRKVRSEFNIQESDLLIVTGGKIDKWKTQTLLLMRAVHLIKNNHVKLLVFGSVAKELKKEFDDLVDGEIVQYAGWINSDESYLFFAAADFVVFPGRHSVFWEQVVAQGIPMVCKKHAGTQHVDLGGNVLYLDDDSLDEIERTIKLLINNPTLIASMKQVAEEKGKQYFSYKNIAKRSIS